MVGRRRFNTLLAGTAGRVALGPLGTAAAQSQSRGAIYASVDARLYRIRVDGDSLMREPRPLILPAQVQEGWQHPSGRYFYIASSDQRTSTARVRHHYLNAFQVDSSGDLQPFGGAVELPHRPIYITVDQRGEYLLSAYSSPSSLSVHRLNVDGSIGDVVDQRTSLDAGFYAHAVYVMPSNRAVLLPARGNEPEPGVHTEDPGGLYIHGFENGQLTNKQTVAPNGGLAYRARHADFHPSGRWGYVDLETQNLLHTYAIRADDTLSEEPVFVSTTLATPEAYRGGQTTSSIRMHPTNGRTLYVANRGRGTEIFQGERVSNGTENTIAVFSVDSGTGEPTLVQTIDTQSIAVRTMAFQPDGRSMVAASPEPGQIRAQGRLETVPAALTLYDIEADGRLAFRSTLPVDTRGETMFWCGVSSAIEMETRHGAVPLFLTMPQRQGVALALSSLARVVWRQILLPLALPHLGMLPTVLRKIVLRFQPGTGQFLVTRPARARWRDSIGGNVSAHHRVSCPVHAGARHAGGLVDHHGLYGTGCRRRRRAPDTGHRSLNPNVTPPGLRPGAREGEPQARRCRSRVSVPSSAVERGPGRSARPVGRRHAQASRAGQRPGRTEPPRGRPDNRGAAAWQWAGSAPSPRRRAPRWRSRRPPRAVRNRMSPSPSGTGHRSLNPNVTPPGLRPGAREGEPQARRCRSRVSVPSSAVERGPGRSARPVGRRHAQASRAGQRPGRTEPPRGRPDNRGTAVWQWAGSAPAPAA